MHSPDAGPGTAGPNPASCWGQLSGCLGALSDLFRFIPGTWRGRSVKSLWTFIFEIAADVPAHSSEAGMETAWALRVQATFPVLVKGPPRQRGSREPSHGLEGWLLWRGLLGRASLALRLKRAELLPQSGLLLELAKKPSPPEPLTLHHGQWCLSPVLGPQS